MYALHHPPTRCDAKSRSFDATVGTGARTPEARWPRPAAIQSTTGWAAEESP
jgi:hypothetical protein